MRLGPVVVRRPQMFPARAGGREGRAATRPLGHLRPLRFLETRDISRVQSDPHVLRPKLFHREIQVVEEHADVTVAAQEARNAADANEPARVTNRLNDLIRLAPEVPVNAAARRVACHHRLLRRLRRFETGAPARMGHVHDHADAVHLGHRRVPEVAQAPVIGLARAIAQRIPAVVGHMHHPHAQLMEDADEPQLVARALPLLAQRHAVGREVETELARPFRRHDVFRLRRLVTIFPGQIRCMREARQPLDQPERIAALFTGVLEDAGHAGRAKRLQILLPLACVGRPARHHHLLAQVGQLGVAGPGRGELAELHPVQRRAWGKAIALKHQRFRMQPQSVLQFFRRGLQDAERHVAGLVDALIVRGERQLRSLGPDVDMKRRRDDQRGAQERLGKTASGDFLWHACSVRRVRSRVKPSTSSACRAAACIAR